jgi:addiction module RelE/StbE family toxin
MNLYWSPSAIEDLKHLRAYIARDNPRAAAEIAKTVLEAVERLRQFPSMGRPGRVPDTRELVVPGTPLVIPYTVSERGVEIIAVLHGARMWPEEPAS